MSGSLAATSILAAPTTPRPNFLSTFQSLYSGTQSDDNVINGTGSSCQLCHEQDNGGNGWNAYGWEIRLGLDSGLNLAEAILAAEAFDSDTDPTGCSNFDEITADTQPGWTDGPNNTIFFDDGTTLQNQLPPAAIQGTLDCPPACTIDTYCTAKVNSEGCLPEIAFTGTPSLTGPDDFFVTATNVLNQQYGFMLWGLDDNDLPFYGGTLCVAPPLNRTPIQYSNGSPGSSDCSGTFAYHVTQSLLATFGAGAQLYAQYWYRDPGVFDLVGLTDGLAWTICP